MIRMEYTGKIPQLQGKTALVRDDPGVLKDHTINNPAVQFVVAQFDDMDLRFGGVRMGAGWHPFLKTDFTPVGAKPVF